MPVQVEAKAAKALTTKLTAERREVIQQVGLLKTTLTFHMCLIANLLFGGLIKIGFNSVQSIISTVSRINLYFYPMASGETVSLLRGETRVTTPTLHLKYPHCYAHLQAHHFSLSSTRAGPEILLTVILKIHVFPNFIQGCSVTDRLINLQSFRKNAIWWCGDSHTRLRYGLKSYFTPR